MFVWYDCECFFFIMQITKILDFLKLFATVRIKAVYKVITVCDATMIPLKMCFFQRLFLKFSVLPFSLEKTALLSKHALTLFLRNSPQQPKFPWTKKKKKMSCSGEFVIPSAEKKKCRCGGNFHQIFPKNNSLFLIY